MDDTVVKHIRRLRLLALGCLASFIGYAGLVIELPDPQAPAVPQAGTLFWGLAFVALANLATVLPSYRAMMTAPRRVFVVGHQKERLLAANLTAYAVVMARVEAVAILGLVLFLLTGRRDWFWVFAAVAALGTLLVWPNRDKIEALVALPGEAPTTPTP